MREYTKEGDKVFDPFAGLGTTLFVSEKMGRIPFGLEINGRYYDFVKSRLYNNQNIVNGDSLKLSRYKFPKFDFSITSPPYIPIGEKNCISGRGGYKEYIKDISKIYLQLKQFMKKGSYVVIEISNLKEGEVTTLAWDVGKEVSKIFLFEGEIIIGWTTKGRCEGGGNYGYGYDHSYCLVFRNI